MQTTPASTPAVPAEVLTSEQAASYLQLHTQTLHNWRVSGRGPQYCKIGSAVRYRRADLDAWLATKLISSTSEAA